MGDASLQNISLVSAMQPDDIKEAIEAAITGIVARTKLRFVHAAARLKFGLDPVDVGAPLPAAPAEPVCVGPRGGGGAPTLKIKVASVLDQASDREVERMPMEVLNKLRARFRAVEGGGGHRRSIVGDLHGGAGRDRHAQISGCGAHSGNVRPKA